MRVFARVRPMQTGGGDGGGGDGGGEGEAAPAPDLPPATCRGLRPSWGKNSDTLLCTAGLLVAGKSGGLCEETGDIFY